MALGKRLTEQQGPSETQITVRKEQAQDESTFQMIEKTNKEAKRQRKEDVGFIDCQREGRNERRSKKSSKGWPLRRPEKKTAAQSELLQLLAQRGSKSRMISSMG